MEKDIRLLLNAIYVAGVESSAGDAWYRLPVNGVEYFKIPQKFGVWLKGGLLSTQSVTKEPDLSLMKEARKLEEDIIYKLYTTMVETLAHPEVSTWGVHGFRCSQGPE